MVSSTSSKQAASSQSMSVADPNSVDSDPEVDMAEDGQTGEEWRLAGWTDHERSG